MNCTAYKEDTMQYVKSIAEGKNERQRKTSELKNEVAKTLCNLHTKQLMLRQDLMNEMNDFCQERLDRNSERLAAFKLITKQLEKENIHRHKERVKLSQNVTHMLKGFDHLQHELRKDLDRCSKKLHQSIDKHEQKRLNEFESFSQLLAQEGQQRQMLTNNQIVATQRLLNQFQQKQTKIANELHTQFAETAKIRSEVQKAWSSISEGNLKPYLTNRSYSATSSEPPHSSNTNKSSITAESRVRHNELDAAESLNNLAMKVKAVLSGFHEGCRISELHRALGDVSKNSVREAIDELLSAKEIRRDDNSRFHLI